MTNVGERNPDRWKPEGMEDHKTSGEVARLVNRTIRCLTIHERKGKIGAPVRVKCGRLMVRMYSPPEVDEIVSYFREIDLRA